MADTPVHPGVKRAAFVGMKAFNGFKSAHVPAKIAARIPVFGPALGVAVLLGATVAGAVSGINNYDGEGVGS